MSKKYKDCVLLLYFLLDQVVTTRPKVVVDS